MPAAGHETAKQATARYLDTHELTDSITRVVGQLCAESDLPDKPFEWMAERFTELDAFNSYINGDPRVPVAVPTVPQVDPQVGVDLGRLHAERWTFVLSLCTPQNPLAKLATLPPRAGLGDPSIESKPLRGVVSRKPVGPSQSSRPASAAVANGGSCGGGRQEDGAEKQSQAPAAQLQQPSADQQAKPSPASVVTPASSATSFESTAASMAGWLLFAATAVVATAVVVTKRFVTR